MMALGADSFKQPTVDVELISLPFLLFRDGVLRTANSGARVLLGLVDTNLESYSYDAVFPPSIAGAPEANRLKNEGHLQILRAKVQSSSELLKLKAAVYNTESPDELKSILVVDVSILPVVHAPSAAIQQQQQATEGRAAVQVPDHSIPTHALAQDQPSSQPPPSISATSSLSSSLPHPHLPSVIKRHSGDIKKIIGATMERRRSQREASSVASQQATPPAPPSNPSTASPIFPKSPSLGSIKGYGSSVASAPDGDLASAPVVSSSNNTAKQSPESPAPAPKWSAPKPSSPKHPSVSDVKRSSSAHSNTSSQPVSMYMSNTSVISDTTVPSPLRSPMSPPTSTSLKSASHRLSVSSNTGDGRPLGILDDAFTYNSNQTRRLSQFSNSGLPTLETEEDLTSGLAQSALAAHPRTGVIISKADLSSGFINSRTRELLMGIKSPTQELGDPFDDQWYSPKLHKEKSNTGLDAESTSAQASHSPGFDDEIMFEDGKIKIDLPDRGANLQTTVSDILRWSLRRRRVRQHNRLLRDDMSIRSGASHSPPSSLLSGRETNTSNPIAGASSSQGSGERSSASSHTHPLSHARARDEALTVMEATLDPSRPWLAQKPYKVYDATFSQRVEDPFELLFDTCVRKGQKAPDAPIIVGIETEVGPVETCKFPENECFTYLTSDNTLPNNPEHLTPIRVRRRMVQARASPLMDVNGEHIGGVVWLRDITGEAGPPPPARPLFAEPAPAQPTTPSIGSQSESNGNNGLLPEDSPSSETTASTITNGRSLNTIHEQATEASFSPGFQAIINSSKTGSEVFWQQIINSMPHMIWVTRPDGMHVYFNNKWYAYTGLQPEQSLGVNWQNPFHPDDMPASRRAWSRSLATGEPYSVEYRCRRHDGIWRWQLGRAQALFDANGKIIAWFGTCTDVDEFVKMRTQFAETSQNLRRVIDLANVTLLAVDAELKVLFMEGGGTLGRTASSAGGNSVFHDPQAVTGKPLMEVIASPAIIQSAQEVLKGQVENARVEIQITPGAWIGCHLRPLRVKDPNRKGVVIVASDITDLKDAEAALKQSYQEQSRLMASETAAKEASRLKSEFTANLSHEIRTPITGMIGMSELLLEEDMTPAQKESVKKILKSGEILLKMVGDVLDIGKVEAGKLELDIQPFVLSDLVQDAIAMFKTAADKKGLTFNDDCCDSLYKGPILGDLPRLRQVLLNFLANSVKFTKQGFITLQVKQDEETPSSILIRFVVEDSGIGISKKVIPLLFQAFQQADSSTSREHGGTGLGLVISKRLVELMNGTVKLDSELGKGTAITVTVPFQKALNPDHLVKRPSLNRTRSEEKRATAPTWTALASPPPGSPLTSISPSRPEPAKPATNLGPEIDRSKIHILLAEDNPLNSEIFVKGLKRMGFNVKAVANGVDAVEAMNERKWDIVLMDGFMPKMDGYEATKMIRQSKNPDIAKTTIIALTASAIAGDKERCLNAGMNGYLSKPVRLKLLEDTVMDFLRRQRREQDLDTAR